MLSDFDVSAKNYDHAFTFSQIGRAQRSRVHQFLEKNILEAKSLSVLELNCGTGEDARFFSEKGHQIIATDISEEMIQAALSKNIKGSVRFVQHDMTTITEDTFQKKFDLIFSNFGGLNCLPEEELKEMMQKIDKLLNPLGKIALVIMPKHCLWETFYFLMKGNWKKATRRNTKKSVMANVDGVEVSTWYYNPKDIVTLAKNQFRTLAIKPIGMTIPPSYLEPYFKDKKSFFRLLVRMESMFAARFWAKYADHYLVAFQKK